MEIDNDLELSTSNDKHKVADVRSKEKNKNYI